MTFPDLRPWFDWEKPGRIINPATGYLSREGAIFIAVIAAAVIGMLLLTYWQYRRAKKGIDEREKRKP